MNRKEVKKYIKYLKFNRFEMPKKKIAKYVAIKKQNYYKKKYHGIIINLEFCLYIVA